MYRVNENIARWGGDPHKVTLFGNSAGSVSIGLHLLYTPQHLYRAAFLISGSPTSFPVPTAAAGTTRTLDRMLPKYCDRPAPSTSAKDYTKFIDCLRSLSIIELIESSGPLLENLMVDAHFPFYPILEGQDGWLNAMPSEKMERGEMSRVPIVAGTVRDEGTGFVRGETSSVEAVGWILQGTSRCSARVTPTDGFPLRRIVLLQPRTLQYAPPLTSGAILGRYYDAQLLPAGEQDRR